jgi:hypothetical protein
MALQLELKKDTGFNVFLSMVIVVISGISRVKKLADIILY